MVQAPYVRFVLPVGLFVALVGLVLGVSPALAVTSSEGQPRVTAGAPELAAPVTVAREGIALQELLAEMGRQAKVSMRPADTLARVRVTVAVGCPLGELMEGLAAVCEGRWESTGAGPSRTYLLSPKQAEAEPFDADLWQEQQARSRQRQEGLSAQGEREARIVLYRRALDLGQEQVLEQFEKADPWVCADLFDPFTRPLVNWVCSLSEADQKTLRTEGEMAWPLGALPPTLQRHLARWITDTHHPPYGHSVPFGPDNLPRFSIPEDRWQNAVVRLRWGTKLLSLEVVVPDVFYYQTEALHLSSNSPLGARKALVSAGLRQVTAEYREAANAEQKEWKAAQAEAEKAGAATLPAAYLVPEPEDKDPRCQTEVALPAGPRTRWSASDLLTQIASPGSVAVVANYLPAEFFSLSLKEAAKLQPATVGSILAALREGREGGLTWSFHGRCLAVHDGDFRLTEAVVPPADLAAELEARCATGRPITLEEFAVQVRGLNSQQMGALRERIRPLFEALGCNLRLYARLTPEQRAVLGTAKGLPAAALTPALREEVLRVARYSRPWFTQADLESAVLRTLPRTLAAGTPGVSFVVEYPRPESPRDRDVIFTLPLEIPTTEAEVAEGADAQPGR